MPYINFGNGFNISAIDQSAIDSRYLTVTSGNPYDHSWTATQAATAYHGMQIYASGKLWVLSTASAGDNYTTTELRTEANWTDVGAHAAHDDHVPDPPSTDGIYQLAVNEGTVTWEAWDADGIVATLNADTAIDGLTKDKFQLLSDITTNAGQINKLNGISGSIVTSGGSGITNNPSEGYYPAWDETNSRLTWFHNIGGPGINHSIDVSQYSREISIDLDSAGGLGFNSDADNGELRINLADASLSLGSSGISVNTGHNFTWSGSQHFNGALTVGDGTNTVYQLPNTAGTAGQVLKYPSTGTTLEWATDTANSSPAIIDNNGTPELASGITAAEIRTLIDAGAGSSYTAGPGLDLNDSNQFSVRIGTNNTQLSLDGAGILGINLAHANDWTGFQTFEGVRFGPSGTTIQTQADARQAGSDGHAINMDGAIISSGIHQYSNSGEVTYNVFFDKLTNLVPGNEVWDFNTYSHYVTDQNNVGITNNFSPFGISVEYQHDDDVAYGKATLFNQVINRDGTGTPDAAELVLEKNAIELAIDSGINREVQFRVEDDGSNYNVLFPGITGGTGQFVTIDADGKIGAATPTDTDTNYTAGFGLDLSSGNEFSVDTDDIQEQLFGNIANDDTVTFTVDTDHNSTLAQGAFGINSEGDLIFNGNFGGRDINDYRTDDINNAEDGLVMRFVNEDQTVYGYYSVFGFSEAAENVFLSFDDVHHIGGTDILASDSGQTGQFFCTFAEIITKPRDFDHYSGAYKGYVPAAQQSQRTDNHYLAGNGSWQSVDIPAVISTGNNTYSFGNGATMAGVRDLIVATSSTGSSTHFLNQQGNFVELALHNGIEHIMTDAENAPTLSPTTITLDNDNFSLTNSGGGVATVGLRNIPANAGKGIEFTGDNNDTINVDISGTTLQFDSQDGLLINHAHDFTGSTAWSGDNDYTGLSTFTNARATSNTPIADESFVTRAYVQGYHPQPTALTTNGITNAIANVTESTIENVWTVTGNSVVNLFSVPHDQTRYYALPLGETGYDVTNTGSNTPWTVYHASGTNLVNGGASGLARVLRFTEDAAHVVYGGDGVASFPITFSVGGQENSDPNVHGQSYVRIRRIPVDSWPDNPSTPVTIDFTAGSDIFVGEYSFNGSHGYEEVTYTMNFTDLDHTVRRDDALVIFWEFHNSASQTFDANAAWRHPGNTHTWSIDWDYDTFNNYFEIESDDADLVVYKGDAVGRTIYSYDNDAIPALQLAKGTVSGTPGQVLAIGTDGAYGDWIDLGSEHIPVAGDSSSSIGGVYVADSSDIALANDGALTVKGIAASKVTSGTLDADRLGGSKGANKVLGLESDGTTPTWITVSSAHIDTIAASQVTSGIFNPARVAGLSGSDTTPAGNDIIYYDDTLHLPLWGELFAAQTDRRGGVRVLGTSRISIKANGEIDVKDTAPGDIDVGSSTEGQVLTIVQTDGTNKADWADAPTPNSPTANGSDSFDRFVLSTEEDGKRGVWRRVDEFMFNSTASSNDQDQQARWNFDAFDKMQSVATAGGLNNLEYARWFYYTDDQSNLNGYRAGALSREIKMAGDPRRSMNSDGDGINATGYAVKTYNYGTITLSGVVYDTVDEYLTIIERKDSVVLGNSYETIFIDDAVLTKAWASSDDSNLTPVTTGVLNGRYLQGSWMGFDDATITSANGWGDIRLVGHRRTLYHQDNGQPVFDVIQPRTINT